MSSNLTPFDEDDNAALDLLLDIGEMSWDSSCWDMGADIMDVLEDEQLPIEEHLQQLQQLEALEPIPEEPVEQVAEMEQLEMQLGWISTNQQNLLENDPQMLIVEDSYMRIEVELARLDGNADDDVEEVDQSGQLDQAPMPQATASSSPWTVVAPLTTCSAVDVLRLCFARISGNEYRIYDTINNVGYQPLAGPPLVISGLTGKPQEQLPDGLQLTDSYVHIFPYSALAEHVKQMIMEETGADVPELLNNADCKLGIALVPDAEWNIMCVGRRDRVQIEFHSYSLSIEQQLQQEQHHSGINIFGEPTCVTMTIGTTDIVLSNEQILEMSRKPEVNIYFYANSSCIYVLNGRTLFESTELGKHILPINNIDLIPYSPPHPISDAWESNDQ